MTMNKTDMVKAKNVWVLKFVIVQLMKRNKTIHQENLIANKTGN
jgi:hypothetical protein